MATIDRLLLAFPPDNHATLSDENYDAAAKQFIEQLKQMLEVESPALVAAAPHLIPLLDPSLNSISTLLLINRLKDVDEGKCTISRPELTQLVVRFLESFDGRQIRYVGDMYLELIQELVECKWVPGPQAVSLLVSAILNLDPTTQMLTTSHRDLAELAYASRQFEAALPVIERPYVFVPGMKNQNDPAHLGDRGASPAAFLSTRTNLTGSLTKDAIIKYDTTCGLIFAELHRWKEAQAAFARVVAFPSRDGSILKSMVTAYKKWIFSSLLASGRLAPLPHIHGGSTKQYQVAAKAYHDVADVFADENVEMLRAEVDKYSKDWEEDDNVDWAKLVLEGYQKWQIISLGNVYSKISLGEVRQRTKSAVTGQRMATDEDVENLVNSMISSGMLNGFVETHTDGNKYLAFLSKDAELSETEFAAEMKGVVVRLRALGQVVQTTDTRLMTHKDYVKFLHRDLRNSDIESQLDAGYGFDQLIEDEDLMVGISQG